MTTKTMLTATAAALALSIGAAAPALADAAMCKDGMMVKSDTMGGDMKQDPMMKDNAMAKGGEMAMKDDGMKKDDMMKDNTMAKGGETFYTRGQYADAAATFARNYRQYGAEAERAPENLLKLGMSLAALGDAEKACASYDELERRFPDAGTAVRQTLERERRSAGCG